MVFPFHKRRANINGMVLGELNGNDVRYYGGRKGANHGQHPD